MRRTREGVSLFLCVSPSLSFFIFIFVSLLLSLSLYLSLSLLLSLTVGNVFRHFSNFLSFLHLPLSLPLHPLSSLLTEGIRKSLTSSLSSLIVILPFMLSSTQNVVNLSNSNYVGYSVDLAQRRSEPEGIE